MSSQETPLPQPDADGYYTMVTDAADGVKDEDLETLPHGDGSAFGYQPKGAEDADD